ncbi:MAG: hypothetical protein EZS28_026289 [Streblomastix strix]|uniref:Uncharacterized protein n=1 Tax=Streblomastix strix TaxID=222440 RepID=A0A5J4V6W9_9EUKA|nr:MAG: hypothetical protein EZS28_026289 [Streblomastix strix]
MRQPFQKQQKKGCHTGPITPANVSLAATHTRHRITPTQFRKIRCMPPRSRYRCLRTRFARKSRQARWTLNETPSNAITAESALLAGLSGHETSQIDFYVEQPSEEQVVEAQQHARASSDLVTRWRPPKHNSSSAQPMLAFDQILADLEMELLLQYGLQQGTLTQIVK